MDVLNWIEKHLSEIEEDLLFTKYFPSTVLEKGIDVFFLLNEDIGIDIILTEDLYIKAIHFYSGVQEGISQFPDRLPFNLDFSFSKHKVRDILGIPHEMGGGEFSFLYGTAPLYDKYLLEKVSLHLQFSEDQRSIDLVSVDRI